MLTFMALFTLLFVGIVAMITSIGAVSFLAVEKITGDLKWTNKRLLLAVASYSVAFEAGLACLYVVAWLWKQMP